MSGLVLVQRGDELLGVGVDAQVDDLEAGALEHHPDQVLADVVDVALDRPDDHLADRLGARLGQQRPQDLHARLHGVGGQQDLGHEQDAVAEVDADDLHAGHERVVEDLARRPAAAQEDVRPLDDLGLHAVVEVVVHLLGQLVVAEGREVDVLGLVVRHAGAPPAVASRSSPQSGGFPRCGTVPYHGTPAIRSLVQREPDVQSPID